MANYNSFYSILYDILLLSIIAILIAEIFLPCSHNQSPFWSFAPIVRQHLILSILF